MYLPRAPGVSRACQGLGSRVVGPPELGSLGAKSGRELRPFGGPQRRQLRGHGGTMYCRRRPVWFGEDDACPLIGRTAHRLDGRRRTVGHQDRFESTAPNQGAPSRAAIRLSKSLWVTRPADDGTAEPRRTAEVLLQLVAGRAQREGRRHPPN